MHGGIVVSTGLVYPRGTRAAELVLPRRTSWSDNTALLIWPSGRRESYSGLIKGLTSLAGSKHCHFGDVLPSQSLGLVLENKNKHNKSKHASATKHTAT